MLGRSCIICGCGGVQHVGLYVSLCVGLATWQAALRRKVAGGQIEKIKEYLWLHHECTSWLMLVEVVIPWASWWLVAADEQYSQSLQLRM
jgi:hypothetical protein